MKRILYVASAILVALVVAACASQSAAPAAQPAVQPAAQPAAVAAPVEPKLIDNCEGDGIGGAWDTYSDVKDNAGSSVSNPSPFELQKDPGKGAKGSDGYAKCFGTVTTKYKYGFAGLMYDFNADKAAFDMSSYTGIKFWMKGDGKTYDFALKSPKNDDFDYYKYAVSTKSDWTEYIVPFSKFSQYSWGKSVGLKDCLKTAFGFQIQTIGQPIDKFEFSIDEVSLY